jgi:hypothetical protein
MATGLPRLIIRQRPPRGLLLITAAAVLSLWVHPCDAAPLTPEDAAKHVGQNVSVCGVVALTNFDADTQFWPTALDFGKPFPKQVFTAVIYGADRPKFGTPKATLQGKRVCVSGVIREYRGKLQMILRDPSQLVR